jgi:hypothetical protein
MSLGDWIALISALGAIGAAIAACLAVVYQVRLARGSSSIDNTVRMQDQWNGTTMLSHRAGAAKALLNGVETDDVVAVLDFFEQLGYLVAEKSVKAEAAWEAFSDWSLPYWMATRKFVLDQQKVDRTYWENFDLLNRDVMAIEAKRRGRPSEEIGEDVKAGVHEFLTAESNVFAVEDGGGRPMLNRTWRRHAERSAQTLTP